MEKKSTWWETNLNTNAGWSELSGWLKESEVKSRDFLFSFIDQNEIKTVLEAGPGIFIDYELFFKNRKDISYECTDITRQIVELGTQKGIPSKLSDIENLDYPDESFDLVYCRHVFEHLPGFKKALSEMIRTSRKSVVVIFWMLNEESEEDIISFEPSLNLFHNKYVPDNIKKYLDGFDVEHTFTEAGSDKVLVINKKNKS